MSDIVERLFSKRPLLVLAPMAGVTDAPFREQALLHGADLAVSEMISAHAMIRRTTRSLQIVTNPTQAYPLVVQIAGNTPLLMAEAARINVDLGAEIIDINMGCPVKKAVKGGSGAVLMRNEGLAGNIMAAVVNAVSVPVTIKIRTGWDAENRNGVRIAKIAEESGIRWVAVHGRTRSQLYHDKADWSYIQQVKENVRIPVIGNGDIHTPEEAAHCLAISGVDGLMIGRAALGNPWLFGRIAHHLAGHAPIPLPDSKERSAVIYAHMEKLRALYDLRTSHLLARKHLAWYVRGMPESAKLREEINKTAEFNDIYPLLERFLHVVHA